MNNNKHISLAIISFFAILVLLKIAATEIQPWDEGLFAIRAKSILQFGTVWDQTAHSPGGLYSATYPPLTVWAIAGAMKIFGTTAFAIRLFSAVCSIASVFLFFAVARKFLNNEKSLALTLLLTGTTVWNLFSRQGMTDVPLNFFILLSFYSIILLCEENEKKNVIWSGLFALAFGLGLMTKIVVSFIPVLFVLIFIFNENDFKKKILLVLAVFAGLAIALPWHIYMYQIHGWQFLKAFIAPHLYSAVENNESRLNFLYYFNQLVIANPFISISFIAVFYYRRDFRSQIRNFSNLEKYIFLTVLIWFVFGFVIFTIALTKLSHYCLYILFPAMLLCGKFYSMRKTLLKSPRETWIVLSILVISTIWSFGWALRQDMKSIMAFHFSSFTIAFLIIVISLILIGFLAKNSSLDKFAGQTLQRLSFVFIILILVRMFFINAFIPNGEVSGGMKTAFVLEQVDGKSFVYLFHSHNGSDTLNPQLAWYSKGWITGWRKGKTFVPIGMPENRVSFKILRNIDKYTDDIIIYYMPQNIYMAQATARDIMETRPLLEQSGRYLIFGKKRWDRRKGKIL